MSTLRFAGLGVLYSTCCAAALIAAAPALAQAVETVTVTGDKYALQKTIDDKLNANIVSDSISGDEIGAIPEFGLGDALRKVPGVSLQINNGRGEDQFITVRGLDPDYTSTTVDGMQLASTEETTRWVSLDVLAAVIVTRVDVDKTWGVDQPSDAVGGVVDLRGRSAFDNPGQFFEAHLDGAYWGDTEQVHSQEPSGQGDFACRRTSAPPTNLALPSSGPISSARHRP